MGIATMGAMTAMVAMTISAWEVGSHEALGGPTLESGGILNAESLW